MAGVPIKATATAKITLKHRLRLMNPFLLLWILRMTAIMQGYEGSLRRAGSES
jgi:hypothetical protein